MKAFFKVCLCLILFIGILPISQGEVALGASTVSPQIASGYYHTVSLISDGTVWSYGRGNNGQLGEGRYVGRFSPVRTLDLIGVRSVTGGVHQSYAILNDGRVFSWGQNDDGQLGIGSNEGSNRPVQVTDLQNITYISSGLAYHALALDEAGKVWSWGRNTSGQLGNGTNISSNVPVEVTGLEDTVMVAAGGYFSLALKADGTVWSWGHNEQGQLGHGGTTNTNTPIQIPDLSNIVFIAAGGNHSLAIDAQGDVWAWGQNNWGAVGDGTSTNRRSPVKLTGISDIIHIAGGVSHTVAVKRDGSVWSWGLNNYSQLGDGTTTNRHSPVQVSGLEDIRQVTAGAFFSTALKNDGTVWSWGLNSGGELGDRSTETRITPVQNSAILDVTSPIVFQSEIQATDITLNSVTLQWEKAEDNMTRQSELEYRLYMSGLPNLTTIEATERNGMALEDFISDIGTFDVEHLSPGTTFYFNVIVRDKVGLKSIYTMQEVTTASHYTVFYDGNGNTTGTPPVDPTRYDYRGQVTVLDQGDLFKEGYSFIGWNTNQNGTGTDYTPQSSFLIERDTTLYAKWKSDDEEPTPGYHSHLNSLDLNTENGSMILSPHFEPGVLTYTAKLENQLSTIYINTVTVDSEATVTASVYDQSEQLTMGPIQLSSIGEENEPLTLSDGTNIIKLLVESTDGATSLYTIYIERITEPVHPPERPEHPPEQPEMPEYPISPPPPAPPVDQVGVLKTKVKLNQQEISNIVIEKWTTTDKSKKNLELQVKTSELSKWLEKEVVPSIVFAVEEIDLSSTSLFIDGDLLALLHNKGATIKLDTPYSSFTIPADKINDSLFAKESSLLSEPRATSLKLQMIVDHEDKPGSGEALNYSDIKVMTNPIYFSLSATDGKTTLELDTFPAIVEKEIKHTLTEVDGVEGITTAVAIEDGGKLRHVPTKIVEEEDKIVASIKGLANHAYALIWNPQQIASLSGHWAEESIADLASRLIIEGGEDNEYHPASPITRAEFISLMIRGLGIPEKGVSTYRDVPPTSSYSAAIGQAQAYGIIQGYTDMMFNPSATISRQESIVIMNRVAKLLEMNNDMEITELNKIISSFSDGHQIAPWAKHAVALSIRNHLVEGRGHTVNPNHSMTNAEAAVLLHRLLTKTDLIN
ncbi:S-layer homology domain-containing protein [Bacillus horti]|uniref:Repeat protein (TIGR02543 family) n=1 Tax=Caldalkalibacillus horti TaxID=77523 RepID=A0ABT9W187_9BACI|nr:S-layer homology domain-containing protein [Bacillus horti]MDQ0167019.1 putative repeat protein (TIGR02543 family) [Bacillus horti]